MDRIFSTLTEYKNKKRISRVIPFGYKVNPDNDKELLPIPEELDALNQAFKFIRQDCSLREVCRWLVSTTGRQISFKNLWVKYKQNLKEKHGKRYTTSETKKEVNSTEG